MPQSLRLSITSCLARKRSPWPFGMRRSGGLGLVHRFGMKYVGCFCLSSSTYPYPFHLAQPKDFETFGITIRIVCGEIIENHTAANIPQDTKAESFYSYLHNPVRGAVAYDTNNGHGLPVTSTKVVPVGYHTHLASIRPWKSKTVEICTSTPVNVNQFPLLFN